MSWFKQMLCIHEWVMWQRHRLLSDDPDIEKCLNCGKFRKRF